MSEKLLTLNEAVHLLQRNSKRNLLNEEFFKKILHGISVNARELKKITSSPMSKAVPYHRHVFWEAKNGSALIGLAWLPGHQTHIHNHNHFGVVKCLQGEALSINFTYVDEDTIEYVGEKPIREMQIQEIPPGEEFIHAVTTSSSSKIAIDLHLYGPVRGGYPYCYDPVEPLDLKNIKKKHIAVNRSVDLMQMSHARKE